MIRHKYVKKKEEKTRITHNHIHTHDIGKIRNEYLTF